MAKWLQKIINGNPNKKDFTTADLPDNRFDQFFDVIKTRFTGLITLNLLYIIFILPMLILGIWIFILGLPEMTKLELVDMDFKNFSGYVSSFLTICIPLNAIAGPATAGMYYVLRNWSWGEHARPGSDFWMEFKRSWKLSVPYNALSAMFIYACFFWLLNANINQQMPEALKYIVAGIVTILLVVYLFMDVYVYPLMVTYKLTFRQLLKNALLIALARVPQTIAYVLSVAAFVILVCLLWQVTAVALLIIGFVLLALAKMLVANSAFDKFNTQLTGGTAPTRRGLSPKKDKLGRVIK